MRTMHSPGYRAHITSVGEPWVVRSDMICDIVPFHCGSRGLSEGAKVALAQTRCRRRDREPPPRSLPRGDSILDVGSRDRAQKDKDN